jgi:hypothetical protein
MAYRNQQLELIAGNVLFKGKALLELSGVCSLQLDETPTAVRMFPDDTS